MSLQAGCALEYCCVHKKFKRFATGRKRTEPGINRKLAKRHEDRHVARLFQDARLSLGQAVPYAPFSLPSCVDIPTRSAPHILCTRFRYLRLPLNDRYQEYMFLLFPPTLLTCAQRTRTSFFQTQHLLFFSPFHVPDLVRTPDAHAQTTSNNYVDSDLEMSRRTATTASTTTQVKRKPLAMAAKKPRVVMG